LTRAPAIDGLAVVLLMLGSLGIAGHAWLRDNPQHNPWAPLSLDDPPGWATQRKLARLRSDPAECRAVLERVGELVTKPVDGHGGQGVLIGPDAAASQVAARRSEIAAHPDRWVAQEVVALSSHPTFAGNLLQPRHVDLRAFVYLWGVEPGQSRLADLALTRVAPEGSLVVNSSRGGGAKDTWIIGGED
jgi:uncharacterized circularly permuted ATP-grasp superfamily protein